MQTSITVTTEITLQHKNNLTPEQLIELFLLNLNYQYKLDIEEAHIADSMVLSVKS